MGSVLLGVLLALLSSSCGGNPLGPSNAEQFVGLWQNVNSQTRGLPQISIRTQEGTTYVHAWGACIPTYCDWGEVTATSAGGTLQAVWNQGFQIVTQTLTLSNGQLQSTIHGHFVDGSGRADYTSTDAFSLVSALPSGTSQLVGLWQNVNPQTENVTQISIRDQGTVVYVHSWGACAPTYCDWGEVAATSMDGTLQVVYNLSTEIETETLTLTNGQLQAVVHAHFIDGSGRADYDSTDVFNKVS